MSEATKDAVDEVLDLLAAGKLDERLELLSGCIRERQRLLSQSKARMAVLTAKVGDTGILKGLRPKYINNVRVKVMKVNRTKILCEPVNPEDLDQRTKAKLGVYGSTCVGVNVPAAHIEWD